MDTTAESRSQMVSEARVSATKEGVLDIVALAANLGLEVYQERLENNAGYIAHSDGDTFIVVNSLDSLTRQRFTIAHEIGHYVNDFERLKKDGRLDRGAEKVYTEEEMAADKFATSLLIPQSEAEEFLKNGSHKVANAAVVEKMANYFNVSKTMAVQRLREIGVSVPYIVFA